MSSLVQRHVLRNGPSVITFTIQKNNNETSSATVEGLAGSPETLPFKDVEGARFYYEYLIENGWERDELASNQASCDHKFVDSKVCLKCGWTPPPRSSVGANRVTSTGR
jgi:hypothetical protein